MMVSNRCTKMMSLQILPVQKMSKENIRKGINLFHLACPSRSEIHTYSNNKKKNKKKKLISYHIFTLLL